SSADAAIEAAAGVAPPDRSVQCESSCSLRRFVEPRLGAPRPGLFSRPSRTDPGCQTVETAFPAGSVPVASTRRRKRFVCELHLGHSAPLTEFHRDEGLTDVLADFPAPGIYQPLGRPDFSVLANNAVEVSGR